MRCGGVVSHSVPVTAPNATGRQGWSETAARAVGAAVQARRRELGLVLDDLGGIEGAPSARTFERLERGERVPKLITQYAIEEVLGWARGTIEEFRTDPGHVPSTRPEGRLVQIPAGDAALPFLARLHVEADLTVEQEAALTALIRARRNRAS